MVDFSSVYAVAILGSKLLLPTSAKASSLSCVGCYTAAGMIPVGSGPSAPDGLFAVIDDLGLRVDVLIDGRVVELPSDCSPFLYFSLFVKTAADCEPVRYYAFIFGLLAFC